MEVVMGNVNCIEGLPDGMGARVPVPSDLTQNPGGGRRDHGSDPLPELGAEDHGEHGWRPGLMAKWDSSENLPSIFKKHNINILPISRNGYVLSDFKLYEPIPELGEHITEMQKVEIPEYETIDIGNISSEANAINVLMLSKILDDFLDEG